jgi:hypothetical protein
MRAGGPGEDERSGSECAESEPTSQIGEGARDRAVGAARREHRPDQGGGVPSPSSARSKRTAPLSEGPAARSEG